MDIGLWMGLTIRGRAVVVGVRENADFPQKNVKKMYTECKGICTDSYMGYCIYSIENCIYGYLPIYIFR